MNGNIIPANVGTVPPEAGAYKQQNIEKYIQEKSTPSSPAENWNKKLSNYWENPKGNETPPTNSPTDLGKQNLPQKPGGSYWENSKGKDTPTANPPDDPGKPKPPEKPSGAGAGGGPNLKDYVKPYPGTERKSDGKKEMKKDSLEKIIKVFQQNNKKNEADLAANREKIQQRRLEDPGVAGAIAREEYKRSNPGK